jgi:hypothetical protein
MLTPALAGWPTFIGLALLLLAAGAAVDALLRFLARH